MAQQQVREGQYFITVWSIQPEKTPVTYTLSLEMVWWTFYLFKFLKVELSTFENLSMPWTGPCLAPPWLLTQRSSFIRTQHLAKMSTHRRHFDTTKSSQHTACMSKSLASKASAPLSGNVQIVPKVSIFCVAAIIFHCSFPQSQTMILPPLCLSVGKTLLPPGCSCTRLIPLEPNKWQHLYLFWTSKMSEEKKKWLRRKQTKTSYYRNN